MVTSATDHQSADVKMKAGHDGVTCINPAVASTVSTNVFTAMGSVQTMYDLAGIAKIYQHPMLVQSMGAVGTKMLLAKKMQQFATLGVDLVSAMTNNIVAVGAKPLTLLNYIANDHLQPALSEQLIASMVSACKEYDIALFGGGDTGIPGHYLAGEHDVVGVMTGVVERDKAILGHDIQPGDVVMAFASNGLHTNGYSLACKLFFDVGGYSVGSHLPGLQYTLGEELLMSHFNYARPVLHALAHHVPVKGMAHITGGGLVENISRILPAGCAMHIRKNSYPVPFIFDILSKLGRLSESEMYRLFNMGIGLVMVLRPEDTVRLRKTLAVFTDFPLYEVGEVIAGERKVRLI